MWKICHQRPPAPDEDPHPPMRCSLLPPSLALTHWTRAGGLLWAKCSLDLRLHDPDCLHMSHSNVPKMARRAGRVAKAVINKKVSRYVVKRTMSARSARRPHCAQRDARTHVRAALCTTTYIRTDESMSRVMDGTEAIPAGPLVCGWCVVMRPLIGAKKQNTQKSHDSRTFL